MQTGRLEGLYVRGSREQQLSSFQRRKQSAEAMRRFRIARTGGTGGRKAGGS